MIRTRLWGGAACAALVTLFSTAARPDEPPVTMVKRPEQKVGPYLVAVDRINQNRRITVNYRTDGAKKDPGSVQVQQTAQFQIALFSDEEWARTGLATFQVKSVTVDGPRGPLEVPHYGGPLESPGDNALVRAYLYVSSVPALAREIRSVDGEVVCYKKTTPLEIDIPLGEGKPPVTVEKDGVRATLKEFAPEGALVRVLLSLEAPPTSVLVNTTIDNSYGVALYTGETRTANSNGGMLIQPRPNQSEYRLTFSPGQDNPTRLRVRVLHRAGPRLVYPFKIQKIPLTAGTDQRKSDK